MTILSGKTIRRLGIITPHENRTVLDGMSYGESLAGYDIRTKGDLTFGLPTRNLDGSRNYFNLASSVERFKVPKNVIGVVHDKSSWARIGVFVQNTIIEPGWEGYLTLEITYHPNPFEELFIKGGSPIAQVVFHYVDEETDGYNGKYQHQENRPVEARYEDPWKGHKFDSSKYIHLDPIRHD